MTRSETRTTTGIEERAVATAKILAADVVEAARGGHPGTAISLAPAAHLLFNHAMRHDPTTPDWQGRDRFVLSAGHTSLTLYLQLFLTGYPMSLEDIRTTRTLGGNAPGHPELDVARGMEMSTGPLGEGLASAVGMAMAARRERGLFDPAAPPGQSVFDHTIWVLASDGDIQEGVVAEASSIAGHQRLGNLVVIWDDNRITAEDDIAVSSSEDVLAKYAAMGWHTQTVVWARPEGYVEDVASLSDAFTSALADTGRPSIIALKTIIGWPSPTKQNTGDIHGSPLGPEELAELKKLLGFDPAQSFVVEPEILEFTRSAAARGRSQRQQWEAAFGRWRSENAERGELFDRLQAGRLPADWDRDLPAFGTAHRVATRVASGAFLNSVSSALPELWGGSADMNSSTCANMDGEPSFLPTEAVTRLFGAGHPYGRTLHFGVREHAMGSILNGIALHGPTRAYGSTFLQFAFHMLPAIRLGAIMSLPVVYIWTHDSIALGEDGVTHQPIEHLAALRAIPNLDVVRPADATETVAAWRVLLEMRQRPTALILSRQDLPVLVDDMAVAKENVAAGAYIVSKEAGDDALDVIIVATGSEVHLAISAKEQLESRGVVARVVSMPCREWFTEQPVEYRDRVLPPHVRARVCVEAAASYGWHDVAGDAGVVVSIDHFGESAPGEELMRKYGFTVDGVVSAALRTVEAAARPASVPTLPARSARGYVKRATL